MKGFETCVGPDDHEHGEHCDHPHHHVHDDDVKSFVWRDARPLHMEKIETFAPIPVQPMSYRDGVELLKRLEKYSPETRTVFLDFNANSQRGSDQLRWDSVAGADASRLGAHPQQPARAVPPRRGSRPVPDLRTADAPTPRRPR